MDCGVIYAAEKNNELNILASLSYVIYPGLGWLYGFSSFPLPYLSTSPPLKTTYASHVQTV